MIPTGTGKLQERVAKLAGGVAVIKVVAATETALKERKHRVEDAVAAAKGPVEEASSPAAAVRWYRPVRAETVAGQPIRR